MRSVLQIVSQRPPPSRCVRNFNVNLVVLDKKFFRCDLDYITFSFVFSQRFSLFHPLSLARREKSMCFCKMAPLRFRTCISARGFLYFFCIFCQGFTGRCRCFEWQKASNNVLPSLHHILTTNKLELKRLLCTAWIDAVPQTSLC